MDATGVATIVLAVGTWGLAGVTAWLALKTRDVAEATSATARTAMEAQERAFKVQEVQVLTSVMGDRAKDNLTSYVGGSERVLKKIEDLGYLDT